VCWQQRTKVNNIACDVPTYVSRHTRKVDVSLSSAENTKREVIVTERRPLERLFQKVLIDREAGHMHSRLANAEQATK